MIRALAVSLALITLLAFASACSGSSSNTRSPTEEPAPEPAATQPPAPTPTPAPTLVPAPPPEYDPNAYRLQVELVASGFNEPLFVTHAGDGSGRLYVLEKTGRIRLMDGSVFLDISDRVMSPALNSYEREQGLLGLAFHPNFELNGYFYVHYNDRQGNHVISRFSRGADGRGDRASEKVLLRQDQPEANFNGGMLAFGPDGYMYIGLGTGGTKRELQDNSQDLGSLLGKILRIDVDRGDPYAIPPDNPFVNRPGARPEVWAYGLRNPYRFSFDRITGDLYIGGPGEFRREWVNFQAAGTPAGQNFGWPILEGTICYEGNTCDRTGISLPILERNTYDNGNCVIIGGYVYRGTQQRGLSGAYLYGDYCSGRIWGAIRNQAGAWTTQELTSIGSLLSSFGEGEDGELYVTDIMRGNIYHIVTRPR